MIRAARCISRTLQAIPFKPTAEYATIPLNMETGPEMPHRPAAPTAGDSAGESLQGEPTATPPVGYAPTTPATNGSPSSVALPVGSSTAADEAVGIDGAPLPPPVEPPTLPDRLKTLLIGRPRDLADQSIFKHVSLIAFLAWVGLGADGLSSSCYGPPEAFGTLMSHTYLGIFLAIAIAATVFIIASCYSHIIEEFPSGGGGYLVASKLLGRNVGVISGCALLVDYVMTITVSIAAAGDALTGLMDMFGALGHDWYASDMKVYAEAAAIVTLIVMNLRGVKESVQILMPIFLIFLLTHLLMIFGTIVLHLPDAAAVTHEIGTGIRAGVADPKLGWLGLAALFLKAYSLGAGTYTGLEAVSNSMPVMREPRVATARRTMRYMAYSLAFTAGGLIVCYLLLRIQPSNDKTMNLVLTERFVDGIGLHGRWLGAGFILATLLSEGMLLVVGAQAGFIDGPRVLANMAHDSWMPRWFSNLSERLATHNGILLMGGAALAALFGTHGNIHTLVVMYSINVFVTFSLSMLGMCRHWWSLRGENPKWRRRLALFSAGGVLCLSILCVSIYEKVYKELVEKGDPGGLVTIAVTGGCVGLCFLIHRYYDRVGRSLRILNETLGQLPTSGEPNTAAPDPKNPAAVILVGDYSGLGIHTMLNAVRFAPDHFKSFIFISVGVIDSGNFKGSGAVESLREHCEDALRRYVDLGRRLGMSSMSLLSVGTDAVDELERSCLEIARKFPKATFFAGQLVFQKDTWLHRFLHNQTAVSLQRRLQWAGVPMVILPTRVR
jgi:amino acid transporter